MQEANRLKRLGLYLFTIIDDLKRRARERGIDVIDFGMGSPDQPTPKHIIDKLCEAAQITENHRYSRADGDVERRLRRSIAAMYKRKFNVDLDPNVAVRYQVRGIPTLVLFKDGKEAGRLVGAQEKDQLTTLIDSAVSVTP